MITSLLSLRYYKGKELTYVMKHLELIRALKKAGCLLKRHGASHDIWINPKTGTRASVPRYGSKEIKKDTAGSIPDDLLSE